jgi:SAM-dependent methyltransferase
MHENSICLMRDFIERYQPGYTVLDVGSRAVKRQRSYREWFGEREYTGIDVTKGRNVDLVVKPYSWPFKDCMFDCVVSGQMLEHTPFFWKALTEMKRVLTQGGVMCLIAPWTGNEHRYPTDCWRILPDGMRAIGDWLNLSVLEASTSESDCRGIFQKSR